MGASTKIKMLEGLTFREKVFCDAYLANGGNATRSALEAYNLHGYNAGANMGYKLLKRARVQNYIQEHLNRLINVDWIEKELQKDVTKGNPTARSRALELLAKTRGMITEKRINIEEQRKEYNGITYTGYSEVKSTEDISGLTKNSDTLMVGEGSTALGAHKVGEDSVKRA